MSYTALNLGNCATTGQTGPVTCGIEPGRFIYPVLMPKGFVIPATALTSASAFNTYLEARLVDSNRATQFFLFPAMDSFKDSTDADKSETRDGFKPRTAQGNYVYGYRMSCLKCDHTNLLNFDLQQAKYDVGFIDDIGNFIGTQATDSTGAAGIAGISMYQISIPFYKQGKYGEANSYMIEFGIKDNRQLNANAAYIASGTVVDSLTWKGLLGVTLGDLTTTVSAATHTAAIGGSLMCGAAFFADTYGTTLAATAAWVVYDNTADPTHASPITPATVSYIAATSTLPAYYLFTFTIAPTTAHVYQFNLAAPSVLLATPFFQNLISNGAITHTF